MSGLDDDCLHYLQGFTKSLAMTVLSEIGDKTFFAAAVKSLLPSCFVAIFLYDFFLKLFCIESCIRALHCDEKILASVSLIFQFG